jgi:galactokinase
MEDLERFGGILRENVRRRARHVVAENRRVVDSTEAMEKGDWEHLGRLMNESHASLRDDYQVSCKELDALAALARKVPGVLGARMTGGGFGGCVVALVRSDAVDGLRTAVAEGYRTPGGFPAEVYAFTASDGAKYCR